MPRVSICIPSYKPDFFEQTLKSALGQSYADTEIIISDDCPTNAIENICEKYQRHISYSRNSIPGECPNFTRLVGLAKGEYIKFLFDDDILNPFCVEFLLKLMESTRHLGTKLSFSPRYLIDPHNNITSLVNHFGMTNDAKLINGNEFIRLTAVNHMNLIGEFSTVMFRKEDCFDERSEFRLFRGNKDGIFRGHPDLSVWIDFAKRGSLIGHPHPLSYFRQHANSSSNHEINPYFIYGILQYEEIMEMALEEGYLSGDDLPVSMRRLFDHYNYWQSAYPELSIKITELQAKLAKL